MERVALLQQRSRSGSFSSHSLNHDDTEIISEAEEINEVKTLLKKAEYLLLGGKLNEAVRCYTDALEIDERNVEVLSSRASTFMSLKDYHSAYIDSEKLINLDNKKAEAHYMRAVTLEHLGRDVEAVSAFLETLSLDMDNMAALSDHVVHLAGKLCEMATTDVDRLKELESYRKLCEVGCSLYKVGYHSLCVKVLKIASKVQTNQIGIQMKLLLTLGHAQAALNNHSEAIQSYQDCYTLSAKNHDHHYQTKSLINLATLLLERNDPHSAIYYYELLLDLESELLSMVGCLPKYWIPSLRCALRLNLSLAYKSTGNLKKAMYYARMYLEHIGTDAPSEVTGESYFNIGSLCEILGFYDDAVKYYQDFLKQTRRDKRQTVNAYGSLSSVYAHLHNWRLAEAYCEQRCEMAQSLGEEALKLAVLQLADLHLKRWTSERNDGASNDGTAGNGSNDGKEGNGSNDGTAGNGSNDGKESNDDPSNHQTGDDGEDSNEGAETNDRNHLERAKDCYLNVIELSKLDSRTRAKALLGLSRCYAIEKLYHYASYHLDSALHLAESLSSESTQNLKHVSRDTGNVTSRSKSMTSQSVNRSEFKQTKSKTSLEREKTLPPRFEISEEDVDLQNEITHLLAVCLSWSLSQNDLLKVVKYLSSLIIIYQEKIATLDEEGSKIPEDIPAKLSTAYTRLTLALVRLGRSTDALCCTETSRDYDVTSSYDDVIMTMPDVVVRKGLGSMVNMERMLQIVNENDVTVFYYSLIGQLLITWVLKPGDGLVAMVTNQYPGDEYGSKIQNALDAYTDACYHRNAHAYCEDRAMPRRGRCIETSRASNQKLSGEKIPTPRSGCHGNPLEALHEMLISPVEEYLEERIVIIPDGILWGVPFSILTQDGVQLQKKVKVTMAPDLKSLAKTLENHLIRVKEFDDLEQERKWQRLGGLSRSLEKNPGAQTWVKKSEKTFEKINPKMTSHPRLVHQKGQVLTAGDDVTMTNDDVTDNVVTSRTLLGNTLTTLTSQTWTGTDVVTSSGTVPVFKQISSHERALVIGAPSLPESLTLHGSPWKPTALPSSMRELLTVAKYLNTTPVTGDKCNRQYFLDNIKMASFLHIATWMCPDHGYLATAPDTDVPPGAPGDGTNAPGDGTNAPDPPSHWLVTCDDIVRQGCHARLVILSGGWSVRRQRADSELLLARAFIRAGAECVLHLGWPTSDFIREKFFHDFYQAMSDGARVTEAFSISVPEPGSSCPFMLIGRDVTIDLCLLKSAMLDQLIDAQKTEINENETDYLNAPEMKDEQTATERKSDLQRLLRELIRTHNKHQLVVPGLIDLLDTTLKRIHGNEVHNNVITLDDSIHDDGVKSGLELLKFLGFAFQPRLDVLARPYVVFPCGDEFGLLVPVYDALRGILEISSSLNCLRAMLRYLPQSQDNISALIDLLCLTKHVTANVQLRLNDRVVSQLWNQDLSRDLMTSLGYHQIGPLLGNSRNPDSRRLQHGALQVLLSISSQKDVSLMYKLDMEKLGQQPSVTSGGTDPCSQFPRPLPSLQPTQIGKSAILMTSPWLSRYERGSEMTDKMALARRKKILDQQQGRHLTTIKTWHQDWLRYQAKESFDLVGVKPARGQKVKVVSTSCQGCQRVPVDYKPPLTLEHIHDRRAYSHYILEQRLLSADQRHRQKTKKVFLPFIRNSVI